MTRISGSEQLLVFPDLTDPAFKNIRFSENPAGNVVKTLQEDSLHRIWALAGGTLYRINLEEKPLHTIVSGLYERVTALNVDKKGYLWAAVMNKGIFRLEKDGWKMQVPFPESSEKGICHKIVFDGSDNSK